MTNWVESADGISTSFDAINEPRKEALDTVAFKRELGWGNQPSARTLSGRAKVVQGFVLGAMWIGLMCLEYFGRMHGAQAALWPMLATAVLLPVAMIVAILLVQRFKLRKVRADVMDRFTLRLGPDALTCSVRSSEVTRVPVSDIAEVLGNSRLAVVTQDAKTILLPCTLDPSAHAAIAQELNARLRVMRATTADYRGASTTAEEDAEAPLAAWRDPKSGSSS